MKLLNKQIDMISWTSKEGVVTPVRFRLEGDEGLHVIRVDHVIQSERAVFGGIATLTFRCSSLIRGTEKIYELTYHCGNHIWRLKKI